jgi:hypothetical protein
MRPPLIWNASTPLLNGCALQSDLLEAKSERNLKLHSANYKCKEIQSSFIRINIAQTCQFFMRPWLLFATLSAGESNMTLPLCKKKLRTSAQKICVRIS